MPDLFDIDSGVLGIEALWTWDDALLLNDQTAADHFHISKVTGLLGGADHEDPRAKKVGRIGENVYPTSPGGVTVVLEGELRSQTLPGLRSFGRALRGAFADLRAERPMDIAPHVDLGGPTGRFHARQLPDGLTLDDIQQTTRWSRKATLGLRLSDPRVYFSALAVDVTGDPAIVTNPGSAPADPILILAGASGNVTVDNGTNTLSFTGVPSGTLIIDFAARTARIFGGDNVQLVVADSDWWDSFVDGIPAGATSLAINQTGATSVQVTFTPADW